MQKYERPEKVTDLLTEDVTYPGWENESASQPRFYIRGLTWGLRAAGTLNVSDFRPHFDEGIQIILGETSWSQQFPAQAQDKKTFSSGWREAPAYNQALRAIHRRLPVFFFKAVQMLAIFEATIRANPDSEVEPLMVYQRMSIEPAVFNVDRFNCEILVELRNMDQDFDSKILEHINQIEPDLLDDLAAGKTVTRRTAEALCEYINKYTKVSRSVGPVRFVPGRKKIGKGRASENEVILYNDGISTQSEASLSA